MSLDTLTHLELPIPPTIQQDSWQRSQDFSNPRIQWNVYLNQICLHTFLPWLQAEHEPAASALPNVWEVVNGTAIAFGHKRLILLPDRSIDTSELRVPQEWIDIPSFAGDYYLAVQVNPDELQVRIWGYTTHEQLKTTGSYDLSDRTYCLDAHTLIQDMGVLWVVQQLHPDEPTQAAIAPLPAIASTQAANLLQRLATAIAQPRLELPFELWGALLESETWQQRHQLRQGITESRSPVDTVTNLSQWFQNAFSASWQALENIISTEELAFSLRQAPGVSTTVQRVKILDLPHQPVLLIVALSAEADDRRSIRAQLRPLDRPLCLPADLRLTLLSGTRAIQSVQSRTEDNSIQLQSFKCSSGTRFSLEIALLDVAIVEDFVV